MYNLIYVGFNCDFLDLQTYNNGLFVKKCELVDVDGNNRIHYKRDGEAGVKKIPVSELNTVKDFGTSMYVILNKEMDWTNPVDVSDFEDAMIELFNLHLDKRIEASILSKNTFNKIAFKRNTDD